MLKSSLKLCISLVVWDKVCSYIQCISQWIKPIVPKSGGAKTCTMNNEKQPLTPFK